MCPLFSRKRDRARRVSGRDSGKEKNKGREARRVYTVQGSEEGEGQMRESRGRRREKE